MEYVCDHDGYYVDKTHCDDNPEKVVYLTFDAGFENGNVEKILDVLRDEQVPASFFVLAHLIRSQPALIHRMAEEGHLVCNHTVHHKNMSLLDDTAFRKELQDLETICKEETGVTVSPFFRPPEGNFDPSTLSRAKELGYKTIFWSLAYADWDPRRAPSDEKAKKLLSENIHNGAIVLLHPTSDTNARILRDVIRDWKAQGYTFASLDRLP